MVNNRTWPVPVLFGVFFLLAASCTVIKEDRTACPCALTIDLRGLPAYPVTVLLSGKDFVTRREVAADTLLTVPVPKSGVWLVAGAGAALWEDGRMSIPAGYDCPPVYLFSQKLETAAETATTRVELHKHFCTLSLSFEGPEGWGEPFWASLRGRVGGLSPDGTPLEGDFSCRLDPGGSVRLPRQAPEQELWLDITMPGQVVQSFALGNYMLDAGYDWTTPDLEDLPLHVNLSVTAIHFLSPGWSYSFPLNIEI